MSRLLLNDVQRAMVIAVVTMRVVQDAINQIVNVISVGYRLMSATGTMDMPVFMGLTFGAAIWVLVAYINGVLINVITMGMVQVPIVQVINMIAVLYSGVTAARTVFVIVAFMNFAV